MKKLFLITLGAEIDRKSLVEHLGRRKDFGMWFYSMPSSFFIYSSLDAGEIALAIKEKEPDIKRYFVTCINDANYYGLMPTDHWDIVNNNGAEKAYSLAFEGYYLKPSGLPHTSGLYCVYKCRDNPERNTVSLKQLLYIGQAEDIGQRHEAHEKKTDWENCLHPGETLCYSYARLDKSELDRCEAALIFINKPLCNANLKDRFDYLDTKVIVLGNVGLLVKESIAEQTK